MTWVNLEDIKQNKLDKERQILYDRTYGRQLKGVKCVEAVSRIAVARSWGKEWGSYRSVGLEFQFWKMKYF